MYKVIECVQYIPLALREASAGVDQGNPDQRVMEGRAGALKHFKRLLCEGVNLGGSVVDT